jgi:hypothetical protein
MRSPQISVGGRGSSPQGGDLRDQEKGNVRKIADKMADYNTRLEKAAGDILFESDIKELTMVVVEEAPNFHQGTGRQTSARRTIKIVFDNGFYLLRKENNKDYQEIHDYIFGNSALGIPARHDLGFRFWRVDEKAQKFREDAVRSSVDLLLSARDKDLAQSIINELQQFVGTGKTEVTITDDKPEAPPANETAAQKRARLKAEAEAEVAEEEARKAAAQA